ncbi:MAG: hypothetical protein KA941_09360, partial [Flavobacteriales bacterium]|nr:hypothetical protein [Flavobacteriales bacterium]
MRAHLQAPLVLLTRLGMVLLLLTLLRWIFFWVYRSSFPELDPGQFFWITLQGLRFDAMTIVVANALWIVLSLVPLPWSEKKAWQRTLAVLFVVANAALLVVC